MKTGPSGLSFFVARDARLGIGDEAPDTVKCGYQPIALTAAARRLLLRAARFLWTTFLSAMESMMLVAVWNTPMAAALSPEATAFRTDLIAVRRRERREEL
jgi:hypothetical protein